MAGDPHVAVLLVGLGVDELSMSGYDLPRVKVAIRSVHATHDLVIHRLVHPDDVLSTVDHENRLLGRMRPKRLEAEILRDSLLMVSGTLNCEPYGPASKPAIASEAMAARNLKDP